MKKIKERLINYLENVEFFIPKTKSQKEALEVRIKDRNQLIEKIKQLNFSYCPSLEIMDCLSQYNTFCDRHNFYYDVSLEDYNDEQLIQIVACEIFNAFQNYFGSGKLSKQDYIISSTILMMYHVGLILSPLKVPYAQSQRGLISTSLKNQLEKRNIIYFPPNENAIKYLNKRLVFDNKNYFRLGKLIKFNLTPNDLIEVEVSVYQLFPTQREGVGKLFYDDFEFKYNNNSYRCYHILYFKKSEKGDYQQLSGNNKDVQDYKNSIRISEKLSS